MPDWGDQLLQPETLAGPVYPGGEAVRAAGTRQEYPEAPAARRPRLSLALVVPLLLVALVATLAGIGAFALRSVVLASFEELEVSAATLDLERFVGGLDRELDGLAADVAAAARHAAAGGTAEATRFVSAETFVQLRLNIACVYDESGGVMNAGARDETWSRPVARDPMELCRMRPEHPLMPLMMRPEGFTGLFDSDSGPFLLVAMPAELAGERAGEERILAGRILDAVELQRINRAYHISIDLWSMRSPHLQVLDAAAGAAVSLGRAFVVNDKDENVLRVYRAIPDALGQPAFLARANVQRELREIGSRTTILAVLGMVCLGISVVVLAAILLRYLLVLPLTKLAGLMLSIRRRGDTGARLRFRRRDEIGLLAEELGNLLDDLSETSRRFAEASYRAGKADIAEGVLHNIGNVLNSLSVSAHAVLERIGMVSFARLETAAVQFAGAGATTDRQQKLLQYLKLGAADARSQLRDLRGEAVRVIENVKRIEAILESQRQLSYGDKAVAQIPLAPLLEDALAMLPAEYRKQMDIMIADNIGEAPAVLGQRPSVLQILTNLLMNAAESIERVPKDQGAGRIDVSARSSTESGRPVVVIEVRDDGVGFAEGDAVRMFQRGFSTKDERGRGIGLHWSAIVAASLQGHLRAQSEGPGRGAVFQLTLPAAGEGESHDRFDAEHSCARR